MKILNVYEREDGLVGLEVNFSDEEKRLLIQYAIEDIVNTIDWSKEIEKHEI